MKSHQIDELLEAIWICREESEPTLACVFRNAHTEMDHQVILQMEIQGLIRLEQNVVLLTAEGEVAASNIIRNHRLAERLFTDVLGMPIDKIEQAACTFEHTLVPEVTESICTILGHPVECPHGKSIPRGACCKERRKKATRAIMPLSDESCSKFARVSYLRSRNLTRLNQLLSMGIIPGVEVQLHQRKPVLVLSVDHSEFAMDHDVASDVYVWPNDRH